MLNHIWSGFFVVAFAFACFQWLALGNHQLFAAMVEAVFESAKLSFDVALGLVGTLCFWLGMMKIAEAAGLIDALARRLTPLFRALMPGVPEGHPAIGSMSMNIAANMLGLDNAATPMGLKAMEQLQELNPEKETASNAQILFICLNAASLTLLPTTIFMYRAQMGAPDPTIVFIPILLGTAASLMTALLAVAFMQRLPLLNRTVLGYFGGLVLFVGGLVALFAYLPKDQQANYSSFIGSFTLMSVILWFLIAGISKKVPVYEVFIEGAKEGFSVALRILPYLVAMLVAIGVFRASGAFDWCLSGIAYVVGALGFNTDFVPALPTGIMKTFSGSGARGMMLETMEHYGVDSFQGRLAAIIQGSTETTFYVLTVYFGAVNVKRIRHALGCSLIADMVGVLTAILLGYWFFY